EPSAHHARDPSCPRQGPLAHRSGTTRACSLIQRTRSPVCDRFGGVAAEGGLNLVRKSVRVLDLLVERGEATAAELADDLGEPRSSGYRLLASLTALEMVEQGLRKGRYRLGIRLVRLGSAVIERLDERNSAVPVMERIHAETGETVSLCV